MTKVYGIYGFTHANIQLPVGTGNAFLQIEFTRGNTQPGPYYKPATYVSTDPVEQLMIENSPLFGKKIVVYREFKGADDEPAKEDGSTPVADESGSKEYPNVTTIEQARVVLKSLGAKAATLTSEDAMKNFMARKNVSFPNFEF